MRIPGKICIDTSAVVEIFRDNESSLALMQNFLTVYLPIVALGELRYGACKSTNPTKHNETVNNFIESLSIIPINREIADTYGKIKSELAKKGAMIPDYDIWIAATAICTNTTLWAYYSHFARVADLKLIEKC